MSELPKGIKGVNGQIYIDLEPYLDLSALDEVTAETTYYLAKHRKFDVVTFSPTQEIPGEYMHIGAGTGGNVLNPSFSRGMGTDLDLSSRKIYNSFWQEHLPFEEVVRLRGLIQPATSFSMETFAGTVETKHAEAMPTTMDFVRSLPLKEIGWTTIFHTTPDQEVPPHRDYRNDIGMDVQFIYINPLLKPFYIMDDYGERYMVNTRAAFFNLHDFHGMERNYKSCFSIRVNGLWSDELKEKTGLTEWMKRGRD